MQFVPHDLERELVWKARKVVKNLIYQLIVVHLNLCIKRVNILNSCVRKVVASCSQE